MQASRPSSNHEKLRSKSIFLPIETLQEEGFSQVVAAIRPCGLWSAWKVDITTSNLPYLA